jgi:hypothetical protein
LQKSKWASQKEGNGKIHMGLCALGSSSVSLVYIRDTSSYIQHIVGRQK